MSCFIFIYYLSKEQIAQVHTDTGIVLFFMVPLITVLIAPVLFFSLLLSCFILVSLFYSFFLSISLIMFNILSFLGLIHKYLVFFFDIREKNQISFLKKRKKAYYNYFCSLSNINSMQKISIFYTTKDNVYFENYNLYKLDELTYYNVFIHILYSKCLIIFYNFFDSLIYQQAFLKEHLYKLVPGHYSYLARIDRVGGLINEMFKLFPDFLEDHKSATLYRANIWKKSKRPYGKRTLSWLPLSLVLRRYKTSKLPPAVSSDTFFKLSKYIVTIRFIMISKDKKTKKFKVYVNFL